MEIQKTIDKFLSLSSEELEIIDNDPQYDGLFSIIQEMSDIVESSEEYQQFLKENSNEMDKEISD